MPRGYPGLSQRLQPLMGQHSPDLAGHLSKPQLGLRLLQ